MLPVHERTWTTNPIVMRLTYICMWVVSTLLVPTGIEWRRYYKEGEEDFSKLAAVGFFLTICAVGLLFFRAYAYKHRSAVFDTQGVTFRRERDDPKPVRILWTDIDSVHRTSFGMFAIVGQRGLLHRFGTDDFFEAKAMAQAIAVRSGRPYIRRSDLDKRLAR